MTTVTHVSPDIVPIVWGFGTDALETGARSAAEHLVRVQLLSRDELADTTLVRIYRSSSTINISGNDVSEQKRFIVCCKAGARLISPDETGTMLLLVRHDGCWELHVLARQERRGRVPARLHA